MRGHDLVRRCGSERTGGRFHQGQPRRRLHRSGDDANNQRISTERAIAVQQYLVANMNIAPNRIQAVGFGENFPIATNDSEEGRSRNRRIEVVLTLPQ